MREPVPAEPPVRSTQQEQEFHRANAPAHHVATAGPTAIINHNQETEPARLADAEGFDYLLDKVAPRLAPSSIDELERVGLYNWTNKENLKAAQRCCAAAYNTAEGIELPDDADDGKPPPLAQIAVKNLTQMIHGLLDVYNNDRAQRAALVVPGQPTPVRLTDIPKRIYRAGRSYRRKVTTLSSWCTLIPHGLHLDVFNALLQSQPDELCLVTYEAAPDPLIYAHYGEWYIKLAEWG